MGKRRILVVDDAEDTAMSLSFLLEVLGHEVKFTTKSTAAVALARTLIPDVAFLDIGMPELDGWQLCRQLRAIPELSGVCVVAISGYSSAADVTRSQDAGFHAHLSKPMKMEDLQALFAELDSRNAAP